MSAMQGSGSARLSIALLLNVVLVTEEGVQHAGHAALKRSTHSAVSNSESARMADALKASPFCILW